MIKENVALDTSQEGPCLDFFMESGSVSGIISVVHVMSWTTTIIITLGSLYFSQIHFEDLEGWSLVLVEKRNSVLTNFVEHILCKCSIGNIFLENLERDT